MLRSSSVLLRFPGGWCERNLPRSAPTRGKSRAGQAAASIPLLTRSSTTVAMSGLPERTLKRRFRNATGTALIDYVQNLRVEAAKRLLETSSEAVEGVSERVGYEDASFFRRLFKRRTGLTPAAYRRLFQSVAHAGRTPGQMDAA